MMYLLQGDKKDTVMSSHAAAVDRLMREYSWCEQDLAAALDRDDEDEVRYRSERLNAASAVLDRAIADRDSEIFLFDHLPGIEGLDAMYRDPKLGILYAAVTEHSDDVHSALALLEVELTARFGQHLHIRTWAHQGRHPACCAPIGARVLWERCSTAP